MKMPFMNKKYKPPVPREEKIIRLQKKIPRLPTVPMKNIGETIEYPVKIRVIYIYYEKPSVREFFESASKDDSFDLAFIGITDDSLDMEESMNNIMFQGTASGVGKSLITSGFCRIFAQDGYKVSPFKSQNMALNSYITKDGKEMGRAQVVQAEAAKILPDVRMNPILLKPTTDRKSQVIVLGKVMENVDAVTYHQEKAKYRRIVSETYAQLATENDFIVIEGAGSPAEINLRANDFVNMGMAQIAQSPVIIIGDIDRGGVFASLYGTIMLLTEEERKMVKGVLINKFRGDVDILREGIGMLEELIGVPVLGIIPHIDVDIEEEDSLTNRFTKKMDESKSVRIKVIRLPHISNFTDFDVFDIFEDVSLEYVSPREQLGEADVIILPGTKNTIEDLITLRESGLEKQIIRAHKKGIPVIGICGGYQMLGHKIMDPEGIECGIKEIAGLGLLDLETIFEEEKVTTQVQGNVCMEAEGIFQGIEGLTVQGYEIHCGRSFNESGAIRITEKLGESTSYSEGSLNPSGNVMGTYIHGIFDSIEFTKKLLDNLRQMKGLGKGTIGITDYQSYKDSQYDKLAEHLRRYVDIDKIYAILREGLTQ